MTFKVEVGISELIRLEPDRGAEALLRVLGACDGRPTAAADMLGVHHATLKRWIEKLKIRTQVERLRRDRGLPRARTKARVDAQTGLAEA